MSWAVAAALGFNPVCHVPHAVAAEVVVNIQGLQIRQAPRQLAAKALGFAAVKQHRAARLEGRMLQRCVHKARRGKKIQISRQAWLGVEHEFLAHGAQDMPSSRHRAYCIAVWVHMGGHNNLIHMAKSFGHAFRTFAELRGNEFSPLHISPPGYPSFPRGRPLPS